MRTHSHRAALVAATTLMLAPLAACTGSSGAADHREAAAEPTPAPTSASPTVSDSPTPEPSPTPSDSPAPVAPATLRDRLLPAGELPATGAAWTAGGTGTSESDALLTLCHRFQMTSIGAMRVVTRTYTAGDASASALVAQFADPQTAQSATAVLTSWHDKCGEQLGGYPEHEVGPLQDVAVDGGSGGWYLLTYGSGDDRTFDAEAMATKGTRITLVRIRTSAEQDTSDESPAATAVRRAAALL